MTVTQIEYGSKVYELMVALRMRVLRKPLGLTFATTDLQKEANDILVGAFENGQLTGCCVLTSQSNSTLQLRQMAVDPTKQGRGIGSAIISFAEKWAKEKGYSTLMLHARKVAVGFYQKCGYSIVGNEFKEIGIPHYKMDKNL